MRGGKRLHLNCSRQVESWKRGGEKKNFLRVRKHKSDIGPFDAAALPKKECCEGTRELFPLLAGSSCISRDAIPSRQFHQVLGLQLWMSSLPSSLCPEAIICSSIRLRLPRVPPPPTLLRVIWQLKWHNNYINTWFHVSKRYYAWYILDACKKEHTIEIYTVGGLLGQENFSGPLDRDGCYVLVSHNTQMKRNDHRGSV